MNLIVMSGRLVKDFKNDNGIARSTLAVDMFKGDTMFIEINVFNKSVDYCEKYLHKGDFVLVDGQLNIYKKASGESFISCSVRTIQGVGRAKTPNEQQPNRQESGIAKSQPTGDVDKSVPQPDVDINDDDLPF